MHFEWDDNKNRRNRAKHGVGFETAALVFDDPCALTQTDPSSLGEERWITLGTVDQGAVLLLVHAWFEEDGEEIIRIISARAATAHERRIYEEAHEGTKGRHRSFKGKKGREY